MGGVAVLAGVVAGCGDDDDSSSGEDVERYCELIDELDQAGDEAFADLEDDADATDEDFAEAERQFIEDNEESFDELRDVVPEEIADDLDVLLEAQADRAAGGEQEEASKEAETAEQRIGEFEADNC